MELKVDGRKVYAATGGRPFDAGKPAVVFLHGAGCDHTVWQLPARWFAWHGYSVLAVDLPGHGRSEGPPLGSIADWRLGRRACSMRPACETRRSSATPWAAPSRSRQRPHWASALPRIALSARPRPSPCNAICSPRRREEPDACLRDDDGVGARRRAKLGGNPAPGLWMTGGTLALFARNAPGVLHADLEACAAWKSGPDAARKVRCPALVRHRRQRHHDAAQGGQELARLIAGSRTVTIADCGHMLLAEAPDAVLDALIDFFAPAKVGWESARARGNGGACLRRERLGNRRGCRGNFVLAGGQRRAGRVICEQPDECIVDRLELLCGAGVLVRDRLGLSKCFFSDGSQPLQLAGRLHRRHALMRRLARQPFLRAIGAQDVGDARSRPAETQRLHGERDTDDDQRPAEQVMPASLENLRKELHAKFDPEWFQRKRGLRARSRQCGAFTRNDLAGRMNNGARSGLAHAPSAIAEAGKEEC